MKSKKSYIAISSKLMCLVLGIFICLNTAYASISVKFSVDLSQLVSQSKFNPTSDHVYIRGTFNSWGTTNPLTLESNSVYSTTIQLTENSYSEYKFFINTTGADNGGYERDFPLASSGNRKLSVTINSLVLPTVFYNDADMVLGKTTAHFNFYYTSQDEPIIDDFSKRLENNVQRVLTSLECIIPQKIDIYIYKDLQHLHSATGYYESADWATGSAWGKKLITLLSPVKFDYNASVEVLVHEFIHIANAWKTSVTLPNWINEGVATYYARQYAGKQDISDLIVAQGSKRTLQQIENDFSVGGYGYSYTIAYFIAKKHGEHALANFVGNMDYSALGYTDKIAFQTAWQQFLDVYTNTQTKVNVKFSVDMSSMIQSGYFNPNTNHVYLKGSFNSWGTSNQMIHETGNEFSVTIPLVQYALYNYKFWTDASSAPNSGWELAFDETFSGDRLLDLGNMPKTLSTKSFKCSTSLSKKILFDATRAQSAANADWVVDADVRNLNTSWTMSLGGTESNPQRIPTPAQSGITSVTSETYWDGGLSQWAVEMVKYNQNYTIETLPFGASITYGDATNAQDLSNYKTFISCEPNSMYTSNEKIAIMKFVKNGGGLFLVADHTVADRNGDGDDAVGVINDLLKNTPGYENVLGISVDSTNVSEIPSTNSAPLPASDPFLHGPMGEVTNFSFNNGGTFTINKSNNPTVKAVFYQNGYSNTGTSNIMMVSAAYGKGRVVVLGDSSPAEDGTGDPNDVLHSGWATYDNGKLIGNATIWLMNDATEYDSGITKIYDIQGQTADSPYKGQAGIKTTGVVTLAMSDRYFLQDGKGSWNGLYVYAPSNSVKVGDSIVVTGSITEYFNLTEMLTITQSDIISPCNTLPEPVLLAGTSSVSSEEYESVLVKVQNAPCINIDSPSGSYEWLLNDGSGTCVIDNLKYQYSPVLNAKYTVTGAVYYTFGNYKVEPRDANDIVQVTSTEVVPASSTAQLTVSLNTDHSILFLLNQPNDVSDISIIDMNARTVMKDVNRQKSINISNLSRGVYILKINSTSKVDTFKFIR